MLSATNRLPGKQLQEQTKTFDHKAETDQGDGSALPGKQGTLGCEQDPRVIEIRHKNRFIELMQQIEATVDHYYAEHMISEYLNSTIVMQVNFESAFAAHPMRFSECSRGRQDR